MINNADLSTSASIDDVENIENNTIEKEDDKTSVEHKIYQINETEPKARALLAVLELHNPKSALVLCNEVSEAEFLARYLMHYGFNTEAVQDEHRAEGTAHCLTKCAKGTLEILICPHHVAEAHELAKIDVVVNYDMPARPEHYANIAKAREGGARTILNLVGNKEFSSLAAIRSNCLVDMSEHKLPSAEEVQRLSAQRLIKKLKAEAEMVELGQFEILAKHILLEENISQALALLLRHYLLRAATPRSEQARERREHHSSHDRPRREREHSREREPAREREPRPANPAAEHSPRPSAPEEKEADSSVTRLYITLGREDDFHDLADLAQFLSESSGVDLGHFLGTGMIRDHSAHIEVDADVADQVINALHNKKKPGADENSADSPVIVCERARQSTGRPHFRKGPPKRRGSFQRR